MKTTHLLQNALATLCCATLSSPGPALAVPYSLHADVNMTNIRWDVGAGSSLIWLSDWELLASASSFDSVNGFAGNSQSAFGQPATASASANSGFSSASAQVSVNSAGNPLGLQASLGITFAPGVAFASGFSTAMAYREFRITGGSGAVNASFGYDYIAHLLGDAPGWGADYRALLSISDGTTTYDLQAYDLRSDPMSEEFSASLANTFTLEYDTPYSISLSVDPDSHSEPDGGPGVFLTALVLFSLCTFPAIQRKAWRRP